MPKDPIAAIYFKEVSKYYKPISLKEERSLLKEYNNILNDQRYVVLGSKKAVDRFLFLYNKCKENGRSVAKLSSDFVNKRKGVNKALSSKIDEAVKNASTGNAQKELSSIRPALEVHRELIKILESSSDSDDKRICTYISKTSLRLREIETTLVNSALRAGIDVAIRYKNAAIDQKDLIQEATEAIWKAVSRYSLEHRENKKQIKFLTYAYKAAENSVKSYILNKARIVRIPRYKLETMFIVLDIIRTHAYLTDITKISNILNDRLKKKGKTPLSEKEVSECLELINSRSFSIDAPSPTNTPSLKHIGKDKTIQELLPDTRPDIETLLSIKQARGLLLKAMQQFLTETEYKVLYNRYLKPDLLKVATLDEMSKLLDVSRERINQIETSAIKKLKGKAPQLKAILLDGTFEEEENEQYQSSF